jgi:asparagine synthase (glutamine-hydrolysing)
VCGIVVTHDVSDQAVAGAPPSERGAGPGGGPGGDGEATRMLERIRHRGPDGAGSHRVGPTWLGHRRLAIVDVEGGTQPLIDEHGNVLVGNGEIYNHAELRAELGPDQFTTSSDNETALRAVVAWGPEAIDRLRGMFAFAVSTADGTLLAARDPLGIKPLYWAREEGRTILASELRAFPEEVRPKIEAFPPGHWWTRRRGLHPFADLSARGRPFATRDEARDAIRDVVIRAVEDRMMADVDVGVLLSGGLDSSIVAAVAARDAARRGTRLPSFAGGVDGSPDLAAARVVAEALDLDHRERIYTAEEAYDALDDAVRIIEHFDPALVRSAVPNHLLAELAARHVKVVLTGEGADELFAGYDYLREVQPEDLEAELLRSVRGLHNLNLQRADRTSMAHGLEARVPFLDLDVIAVAARVPVTWKLPGEHGEEKRLLREAFADWLPDEILWRRKAQFGDGSGAADALGAAISARLDDADARDGARLEGLPTPRSAEEAFYQRIFARHLGGIRADKVLGMSPHT